MADAPVVAVCGEAYREVAPELARFTVTATARDRDRKTALTRLAERAAAVRVLLAYHGGVRRPQPVEAAVEARFTISEPVLA